MSLDCTHTAPLDALAKSVRGAVPLATRRAARDFEAMLQRAQALGWRPPAAAMPDNVIPLSRFRDTTRRDADDVLQQLLCDTRLAIGRTLARRGAPTMPPIRPWRGHRLWFAAMFVFTAVLVASLAGVA